MPFIFIFYSCVNKIQPFGKQLDVNHILITALFVCIMIVHYFIVQHTYYYLNYDFYIHPCRPSIKNYNRRPLRPAIIRFYKGWGRILMCVLCCTISLWHKVIRGPSHYFFWWLCEIFNFSSPCEPYCFFTTVRLDYGYVNIWGYTTLNSQGRKFEKEILVRNRVFLCTNVVEYSNNRKKNYLYRLKFLDLKNNKI